MVPTSAPSADVALLLKAAEKRADDFGATFDRYYTALSSPESEVFETALVAQFAEVRQTLAKILLDRTAPFAESEAIAKAMFRVINDQDQFGDLMFHLGALGGAHSKMSGLRFHKSGRC